jgi:hypothetical protein
MALNILSILENFLNNQGYWTRRGCTIVLIEADREAINEPYLVNPEIPVLGYCPPRNELLWIEPIFRGIASIHAFTGHDDEGASRYKLFTDEQYRQILSQRLSEQLVQAEIVLPHVVIKYGLWSKIDLLSRSELERHFQANQWVLLDDENTKQWKL